MKRQFVQDQIVGRPGSRADHREPAALQKPVRARVRLIDGRNKARQSECVTRVADHGGQARARQTLPPTIGAESDDGFDATGHSGRGADLCGDRLQPRDAGEALTPALEDPQSETLRIQPVAAYEHCGHRFPRQQDIVAKITAHVLIVQQLHDAIQVFGRCRSQAARWYRDIGVKDWFHSFFFRAVAAELALKRKLSFPVSKMWQRWVRRSSKAVVILASPKTVAHSLKLRVVVMTTLVRS